MNILNFQKTHLNKSYLTVSILGKISKLNIKYINISSVEVNQQENEISIILPKKYKNKDNIEIINLSIQKLYNKLATNQLEYFLDFARYILKIAPEDYLIKRLNNCLYKITNTKILYINPDIIQYTPDVIMTIIMQAFCKLKYKPGSNLYKKVLTNAIEQYEEYKNTPNFEKSNLKVC